MSPLRACLVALVMLNIGFVQITEAASGDWLWPMYGLALVSPMLARFAERGIYRALWNFAVLAIFGTLVHHAANSGIRHLLEDGLVLAAFCQVHLLNTLSARQRPDLLFLNSFLIALVTSFFCQDLVFCAVFAVYSFVLLAGLQLALGEVRTPALRALLADGAKKSVLALGITLLAFVFVPRDFRRPGLVAEGLLFPTQALQEVGFREDVTLGASGPTVASDRLVLRITVPRGRTPTLDPYLRGATCSQFDEHGWQATTLLQRKTRAGYDPPWHRIESWTRPELHGSVTLRVEAFEPSGRVFLQLGATSVALLPPDDSSQLAPLCDGTFLYTGERAADSGRAAFRYEVEVNDDPPRLGGPIVGSNDPRLRPLLELPEHAIPPDTFERAREWAGWRPGQEQRVYVEAVRAHLAGNFRYLAPGANGAARDLREFLERRAGGHCEYFATALAVLLRSLHIPCRVVTGYLASEWDDHGHLLVRSRDAHAWVEVLDPEAGWYVVDATPAAARAGEPGDGWLAAIGGWFETAWRALTGFDDRSRASVVAFLRDLPAMVWAWLTWPRAGLLVLVALLFAWLRRRWRDRRVPAAARAYARIARARHAHETPREFLERARTLGWSEAQFRRLAAATREHESARYRAGGLGFQAP